MKYRKKPVVIEAVQYIGTGESFEAIDEFADGCLCVENDKPFIKTLECNVSYL